MRPIAQEAAGSSKHFNLPQLSGKVYQGDQRVPYHSRHLFACIPLAHFSAVLQRCASDPVVGFREWSFEGST